MLESGAGCIPCWPRAGCLLLSAGSREHLRAEADGTGQGAQRRRWQPCFVVSLQGWLRVGARVQPGHPQGKPQPWGGSQRPQPGLHSKEHNLLNYLLFFRRAIFHLNNSMFSVGFASYLEGSVFSYIIIPSSRGTLNSRVLVCPTMLLVRWVVLNCKHFKA